jgi:hypothetical protein
MAKLRQMLSVDTLIRASELVDQKVPIAVVHKVLGLYNKIHYRTFYDIVKADCAGFHSATRPSWLEEAPPVQIAPPGWVLDGGLTKQGTWHSNQK